MTRRGLSETEAKAYRAVRAFHLLDPPQAPTLAQVAEVLGWKSTSAVHEYAKRIEAAGYVHRGQRRAGIHLGAAQTAGAPS